MKSVDLYGRVRHAVLIEGMSRREAVRLFGIDHSPYLRLISLFHIFDRRWQRNDQITWNPAFRWKMEVDATPSTFDPKMKNHFCLLVRFMSSQAHEISKSADRAGSQKDP